MTRSEFDVASMSLLESVVDYIGKDNLLSACVIPDEITGSAHVEVALEHETPDGIFHAIDRMAEVRRLFIDEISIDYVFADPDEVRESSEKSHRPELCYV